MAPAISLQDSHLTLTHKIRKPLVEKLRRERINGSIEQLKSLLAAELLAKMEKMEKADVLEMTVCVLRRLRSVPPAGTRFGTEDDLFPGHSSVSEEEEERSDHSAPWRPW
ncbi:transcription factor HES-5-like [Festucalex cinctus]